MTCYKIDSHRDHYLKEINTFISYNSYAKSTIGIDHFCFRPNR